MGITSVILVHLSDSFEDGLEEATNQLHVLGKIQEASRDTLRS